jgi:prepilin-type N-terminal cleavage/methylation domain-containing protein
MEGAMRNRSGSAGRAAAVGQDCILPSGSQIENLRHQRSGGFTLIEVLVAAMILGIGLVGVSSMVYYGVLSHQKSANYTIAGEKAMQEMERIRDAGYLGALVDLAHFPSPSYQIVNASTVHFSVPELTSGLGVITIAEDSQAQAINPATGQPYLNMKQVSVTVSWGGSQRLRGSYNLATLISNRP